MPLRQSLPQHEVSTAYERGRSKLKIGELLDMAENQGFVVLITTDSNLAYQENLKARRIAIIALTSTSWPRIQRAIDAVVGAINGIFDSHFTTFSFASMVFLNIP